MRRTLPLGITFVVGILIIINSVFKAPAFDQFVQNYITKTISISTAFATALGAMNLLRVHGNKISFKREGWGYSILLWAAFWGLMLLGIFLPNGNEHKYYRFFYTNINVALSSTMFSVLCFYIASAAYRAFRVRNTEAIVLLGAAVLVMLGSVPVGEVIWSGFPPIKNWITDYATTASLRGMGIGITLGALAQSVRNLLGIERGHLGGE